jgi:hypothetical protein
LKILKKIKIPHYHLINCDSIDILKSFIVNKEIGIRMLPFKTNEVTNKYVASQVRMCWDYYKLVFQEILLQKGIGKIFIMI